MQRSPTSNDPNTMPKTLLGAHKALDKAVDARYGKRSESILSGTKEFVEGR